jgi:hypothetical protein
MDVKKNSSIVKFSSVLVLHRYTSFMKQLLSFSLLITLLFGNTISVFSLTKEEEKLWYNQYKTGDYSYSSNVSNLCIGERYGGTYWKFNTSKQLIIEHNKDKYPDLSVTSGGLSFEDVGKIYLGTQDNIMNCAVLKSKFTLHTKLIQDYKISEKAKWVLVEANEVIKKQISEQKCVPPRDGDKIYASKDLLDSLSYEQCVYSMYLFYYKRACEGNIWICLWWKKPTAIGDIAEISGSERKKVNQEAQISHRTLETALSLYENFERTYIAHVLLELIEVELTEDKRIIGVTMKAIQQWISLAKNAQKSVGSR